MFLQLFKVRVEFIAQKREEQMEEKGELKTFHSFQISSDHYTYF